MKDFTRTLAATFAFTFCAISLGQDENDLEDEFVAGYFFAKPISILEEAQKVAETITIYTLQEGFSIKPKHPKKRFRGSVIEKKIQIDDPTLARLIFSDVISGIEEGCRLAVSYSEGGKARSVSLPDYPDWPKWGISMKMEFNGTVSTFDLLIASRQVSSFMEGIDGATSWVASPQLEDKIQERIFNHAIHSTEASSAE